MERSRLRQAFHQVADHILHAPERQSDHYRPSAQRDVGRSAAQAADVQLVIAGLELYRDEQPGIPVIERPEAAQLRYTQPAGSFGYLDKPDFIVDL